MKLLYKIILLSVIISFNTIGYSEAYSSSLYDLLIKNQTEKRYRGGEFNTARLSRKRFRPQRKRFIGGRTRVSNRPRNKFSRNRRKFISDRQRDNKGPRASILRGKNRRLSRALNPRKGKFLKRVRLPRVRVKRN